MVTLALGCAAGAIAAFPFVRWARRETVAARTRPLQAPAPDLRPRRRLAWSAPLLRAVAAMRERRALRRRDAQLQRELPVVVDLVSVAVAAGCTPHLAVEHAVRYAPGRAAEAVGAVPRACALGQPFEAALRDLGIREAGLRPLTDALRTSARLGSPAGPTLARLADDVRAAVRRRAEARARTVPVRLCFPLVACVLPAFALLTVAPAVLGGLST
jgi:Flp pilus assembly protein TadB